MSSALRRRIERLEADLALSGRAGDQSADAPVYQCVFEDSDGVIRDYATREPVKVEPSPHDLTFSIVGNGMALGDVGELDIS